MEGSERARVGVMEVARSHARESPSASVPPSVRPPVRRNNRRSPSEAPPGSEHTLIGPGSAPPRARPGSLRSLTPHTRSRRGALCRGAFAREFYERTPVRSFRCCECRGRSGRGHRSRGPTDSDGCRVVYFASRYGLMDWRRFRASWRGVKMIQQEPHYVEAPREPSLAA